MSINEWHYKINIKALQNAVSTICSTPDARLEIEPNRVALIISGEYAWVAHGAEEIARVLDGKEPVDLVVDEPTPVLSRQENMIESDWARQNHEDA